MCNGQRDKTRGTDLVVCNGQRDKTRGTDLRVCDGQRVDPDPPAPPLVLDGVVEQHPEDVEHHLRHLGFFRRPRVEVRQGEHPVLPH